ncbi:MAG TPA: SDR family NAD(P)-dependent oxidoreductase [Candidatus Aminicenantes bacterium]|nr:SDR family NAD(P)-dependent oxidoreductase [Candidatus Aminicenantes bacterium]
MELSSNTVLITGGATGIGYALAEAFVEAGSRVIICGRRLNRLEEAKRNHPEIDIIQADAANPSDRARLLKVIVENFPSINILVNNAGIQKDIDFASGELNFEDIQEEIKINLEAPVILSAMFIPHLKGKKNAAIINVSSGLGFVPAARMPVYSATKAGLHAFSIALRHQLSRVGIKVFEVVPPAVDTELNPEGRAKRANFKIDLKPAEFVAGVMEELKSDVFEIGYGPSKKYIQASRAELDEYFRMMNSRW